MKALILIVPGILFAFFKFTHVTLRFGDSNAYLYMAHVFWEGVLPYRDFFFSDPPTLIYVLSLVSRLLGDNYVGFMVIPFLFELINAYLLYYYLAQEKQRFAYLAPLIYLGTFTVLATSDYVVGVQITVFFTLLAFIAYAKKRLTFSAVFWALALTTKLYSAITFIGFLIVVFRINRDDSLKIVLRAVLFAAIICLPFVPYLPDALHNIVVHQLNRPEGIPKLEILYYFIQREWLLIGAALLGICFKRNSMFVLPFLLTLFFFLTYRDLYYLYLQYTTYFYVYFAIYALHALYTKLSGQLRSTVLMVTLLVYVFFFLTSINFYFQYVWKESLFSNASKISSYISNQWPRTALYGSHEVVPLIALQSKTSIFGNYIDTNTQTFASGTHDKTIMSKQAVESGVLLLGRIWHGKGKATEAQAVRGYFDAQSFIRYCTLQKTFPDTGNSTTNAIGIYFCKK